MTLPLAHPRRGIFGLNFRACLLGSIVNDKDESISYPHCEDEHFGSILTTNLHIRTTKGLSTHRKWYKVACNVALWLRWDLEERSFERETILGVMIYLFELLRAIFPECTFQEALLTNFWPNVASIDRTSRSPYMAWVNEKHLHGTCSTFQQYLLQRTFILRIGWRVPHHNKWLQLSPPPPFYNNFLVFHGVAMLYLLRIPTIFYSCCAREQPHLSR